MTFVIDASVALKWFVEEQGTEQAAALLAGQDLLIAPDLIVAEVANAGWNAVRAGTMSPEQHDHAAARLPLAFDALIPLGSLAERAVAISHLLDHPAYDCLYLALAEQRTATLVTADQRLLDRLVATEWQALAVNLRSIAAQ
ncbi:MAG TPA: type II toxin-antitoxin system VapC family toxin [Acetobacteraceae bacterium]